MSDKRETSWRSLLWRREQHEQELNTPASQLPPVQGACTPRRCLGPWTKISDTYPMKRCDRCSRES